MGNGGEEQVGRLGLPMALASETRLGSYALLLRADCAQQVIIGALGSLHITPGYFVYVGSAFGAGGLAGRLAHHFKESTSPHWHIDHLRRYAQICGVWWTCDQRRREHEWANVLIADAGAVLPLPHFGASDCRCASHLVWYHTRPTHSHFAEMLRARFPDHTAILEWSRG